MFSQVLYFYAFAVGLDMMAVDVLIDLKSVCNVTKVVSLHSLCVFVFVFLTKPD